MQSKFPLLPVPSFSDGFRKNEKIKTLIFPDTREASRCVASHIAARIKASPGKFVLGLATGATPIGVYQELVSIHKNEGLSFKHVITFNLDEYYPMQPDSIQSYVRYMREYFFDHVDIPSENIHIPNGTLPLSQVSDFCKEYDQKIHELGGLDLQILGIGRSGHIGFNEPGSAIDTPTRLINLDHLTKVDAASDFFGDEHVPARAITMGIGTIMQAKEIILMAWGEGKSSIVAKAVEADVSAKVPASYLQTHPNTLCILDEAAAVQLTRCKSPWLLGKINWTEPEIKKAIIWLSRTLNKPILKLTDHDYQENGMADLILELDSAYRLNIKVFNQLQQTITGWPGGKPNADDSRRPERAIPMKKRVLLFSPHPDDDVISMGGTFQRLVEQGHEVHVAYQTSGNIAVFNEHVLQMLDFVALLDNAFNKTQTPAFGDLYQRVFQQLNEKQVGQADPAFIQIIKGLVRQSEAKAGARYVGIPDAHIHFLNLPFYETGLVKKNLLGEADIQLTVDLIEQIKPHQIFAAGDLSDPHGTHRVCLDAIFKAIERIKHLPHMKECWVWLYRGAWQEWPVEEIDMAVPLSPDELKRKRKAIFKHQSQKDSAPFPGPDSREFWQRAEDRNRETAAIYNQLGLAEYEAMEAFKRYYF